MVKSYFYLRKQSVSAEKSRSKIIFPCMSVERDLVLNSNHIIPGFIFVLFWWGKLL